MQPPDVPGWDGGPAVGGSIRGGIAAHILPSSSQGPRSRFITPASTGLNDVKNGIWLCDNHAAMIDKNDGADYPPFVLHAWKQLHEATVALRRGGITRRAGWMHELKLGQAMFAPGGSYRFGPANLFIGPSPSGKSALLNLLTAQTAGDVQTYSRHGSFDYELTWFDPDLQKLDVEVRSPTEAIFRYKERKLRMPPCPPIRVGRESYGPTSTLQDIADRTGLALSDVEALFPLVGTLRHAGGNVGPLEAAWFDAGNPMIRLRGESLDLPLASLSGGAQTAVLVEVALQRALAYADGRPLVFTFDPFPTILQQHMPAYVGALLDHAGRVQVFATMCVEPLPSLPLNGWEVFRL
jgi:hypothetical protein